MSRNNSPRISGDASSSRNSPLLDSGAPSRVSKNSTWRAASHIGSVPDDWPMYSAQASDYLLGPVIGFGASSIVYQASFEPLNGRACAVKVIDLEAFGRDLGEIRRETQLMSLSKHPNVLRVRGCWVNGSKLHIATRLMSSGSMLDIMCFSFSEGFEEVVIATVLKQALEGLNYLHVNNWLHR
jgi:serine/threonine protein kinase